MNDHRLYPKTGKVVDSLSVYSGNHRDIIFSFQVYANDDTKGTNC